MWKLRLFTAALAVVGVLTSFGKTEDWALMMNAFRARRPLATKAGDDGGKKPRHLRSSWTGAGVHDSGGFGLLEFR